jgi:hypothetical protein
MSARTVGTGSTRKSDLPACPRYVVNDGAEVVVAVVCVERNKGEVVTDRYSSH